MKKIIYALLAIILLVIGYYSVSSGENSEDYQSDVLAERKKKENFLKSSQESPFVMAGIEMQPLDHYPIDPKYRVTASVEKIETRQFMMIRNSDGTNLRYLKYAWLYFKIDEKPQKLLVLKPVFGLGLFLGFADETSGETTYGGGRYLDLEQIKGDRLTLDFNLAYNPYCAYFSNYNCPLPPKENILKVAISAGEKDYRNNK